MSLLGSFCYARQKKQETSSLTVHFNYRQKKIPDSLLMWTYPKNNYWQNSTDYPIKMGKNQEFRFVFPKISKFLNYRLNLGYGSKFYEIGTYFAQPGDHIRLEIFETSGEDSLVFIGKGSAKYELIERLIKAKDIAAHAVKLPKNNVSIATLDTCLDRLHTITMEAKRHQENLIATYRKLIKDEDMIQLVAYQYANYDAFWAGQLMILRSGFSGKSEHLQHIKTHFNRYYPKADHAIKEVSLYSHRYYQLLLLQISYKIQFDSPNGEANLRTVYHALKNYSTNPRIRDRMLTQFLVYDGKISTNYSQSAFDSIARDAEPYLISQLGKEVLSSKLLFKKGSTFFDAEFSDLDGNPFHTSSLRGKVFLVDVWGEGCGACVLFHNWFEAKVWPLVKDLKNFRVLSVFDGKDKASWERGIQSDKYTSAHYLNVSDIPYRMNTHPFFKYYQVNAAPFLLLVDKNGKIVSRFQVRESDYKQVVEQIKRLTEEPMLNP
jgi:cytochrome oxidase Cu insertion factor (SCO1/SenC/PrrC family)